MGVICSLSESAALSSARRSGGAVPGPGSVITVVPSKQESGSFASFLMCADAEITPDTKMIVIDLRGVEPDNRTIFGYSNCICLHINIIQDTYKSVIETASAENYGGDDFLMMLPESITVPVTVMCDDRYCVLLFSDKGSVMEDTVSSSNETGLETGIWLSSESSEKAIEYDAAAGITVPGSDDGIQIKTRRDITGSNASVQSSSKSSVMEQLLEYKNEKNEAAMEWLRRNGLIPQEIQTKTIGSNRGIQTKTIDKNRGLMEDIISSESIPAPNMVILRNGSSCMLSCNVCSVSGDGTWFSLLSMSGPSIPEPSPGFDFVYSVSDGERLCTRSIIFVKKTADGPVSTINAALGQRIVFMGTGSVRNAIISISEPCTYTGGVSDSYGLWSTTIRFVRDSAGNALKCGRVYRISRNSATGSEIPYTLDAISDFKPSIITMINGNYNEQNISYKDITTFISYSQETIPVIDASAENSSTNIG